MQADGSNVVRVFFPVGLAPRGGDGAGMLWALGRQLQIGTVVVDGLSFAGREAESG